MSPAEGDAKQVGDDNGRRASPERQGGRAPNRGGGGDRLSIAWGGKMENMN